MNVKTERKRALEQSTRIQKPPTACTAQHAPPAPPAPPVPPILRRASSTGLSDVLSTSLLLGVEPISSQKRKKPPLAQDLTLRQRQGLSQSKRNGTRPLTGGSVMESITVGDHTLRWRRTESGSATGRGLLSQAGKDGRNKQRPCAPPRSTEARAAELEPEQIAQHCDVLFGAGRVDALPHELLGRIQHELRK